LAVIKLNNYKKKWLNEFNISSQVMADRKAIPHGFINSFVNIGLILAAKTIEHCHDTRFS